MSQLMRCGHKVNSFRDHHRCSSMPECVRVDMRQLLVPAELVEPVRYAVRIQRQSVVPCEYITGIIPQIAACKSITQLLYTQTL